MKLLTKEILNRMPKLYETEEIPVEEKDIVVKFFTPDSNWTWYITEGEDQKDENGNVVDFLMFGLVDGFEKEWGYVSLNELKSAKGPLGLSIERDMYFRKNKIKEIL